MSGREVLRARVDDLHADAEQVRTEFDQESLPGLAESMKRGQLQPVLAYRRGDKLVLLDGERRVKAAKLAGLPDVDVIVVDDPVERGTILERQLASALQRDDLNPIDKGRGIHRLLTVTGLTRAAVAENLGISAPMVTRLLKILELPEDIQRRVAAKEITLRDAYELAKSGNPGKGAQANGRGAKGKAAPRVTVALGGGRSVTLSGPGLETVDQLVEWLEEFLKRTKSARPRGLALQTYLALMRDEAKARDGAS